MPVKIGLPNYTTTSQDGVEIFTKTLRFYLKRTALVH